MASGPLITLTSYLDAYGDYLTISKSGSNYVIKGLLTLANGKTLNINTGKLEFGDYATDGGASPLSTKCAKLCHTPRCFSSVLIK